MIVILCKKFKMTYRLSSNNGKWYLIAPYEFEIDGTILT